jgi:hypothetical protein
MNGHLQFVRVRGAAFSYHDARYKTIVFKVSIFPMDKIEHLLPTVLISCSITERFQQSIITLHSAFADAAHISEQLERKQNGYNSTQS